MCSTIREKCNASSSDFFVRRRKADFDSIRHSAWASRACFARSVSCYRQMAPSADSSQTAATDEPQIRFSIDRGGTFTDVFAEASNSEKRMSGSAENQATQGRLPPLRRTMICRDVGYKTFSLHDHAHWYARLWLQYDDKEGNATQKWALSPLRSVESKAELHFADTHLVLGIFCLAISIITSRGSLLSPPSGYSSFSQKTLETTRMLPEKAFGGSWRKSQENHIQGMSLSVLHTSRQSEWAQQLPPMLCWSAKGRDVHWWQPRASKICCTSAIRADHSSSIWKFRSQTCCMSQS